MARRVDHVTAEPVRVLACLRLPLIGLIVATVVVEDVQHWLPTVYAALLAAYTVAAIAWLVIVLRGPVPAWGGAASTAIDVVAVLALCTASGAATATLFPVFILLPIAMTFQQRPWLTALTGLAVTAGYLAAWLVYAARDDTVGLPPAVYTQLGLLLWLTAATSALCLVLRRRADRIDALHEERRRLVAESLRADERRGRELAEGLHDGALQDVLAARMDVGSLRRRAPGPELDRIHASLGRTADRLRTTVTALHPQVLAEVGLTAALRELLREYENRGSFTVTAELEDVGTPSAQGVAYRAAGELLANAAKHADASAVAVTLHRRGERLVLTVGDDGRGFDPGVLAGCVARGHIGLSSLLVAIEATGGTVTIESAPGAGTRTVVDLPAV